MKRILLIILAIMLFPALLSGCGKSLSEPETNLEFWIAENVDDVDFSSYQQRYGLFGGYEYYGTGYTPTTDADGQQIDPEHCVIYTVTSYPDYSSGKQHITRISITDPAVKVYGLTINSSAEDIKRAMENEGFTVEETAGGIKAEKGDFRFSFSENSITIAVNVTNKLGIIF